jgi:hypothetical protein
MRQSRAPLRGQAVFFAAQFSAGYITSMPGFDLRQAQVWQPFSPVRPRIVVRREARLILASETESRSAARLEQSAMSIWLSVIRGVDGKVVLKDRHVLV